MQPIYNETRALIMEEIRDRRVMLKVKAKSLADEARIIRKEERRASPLLRGELHLHRVSDVRSEARATHLAYGLIRGRSVERIERSQTRTPPLWLRVQTMVKKYGPVDAKRRAALLEQCKD
jgi:hypothetical protein